MVLLSKVPVVALHGRYDRQSVSEVFRRVESVVMGMVEYIDKEAVCEDAKTWFRTRDMKLYNDCVQMVRDRVTALPAADVRENVKGEWIKMDMHRSMENYKCSVCRSECYVPELMGEPMFPLCPYCGAQMGGAEDG